MEGIRMVIGRLSIRLQEEIIKRAAEAEPDIKVLGVRLDQREVRRLVRRQGANVVIIHADDYVLRRAWDLLAGHPDVIVAGIGDDGRRFTFCAANLDAGQVIATLRGLRTRGGDEGGRHQAESKNV